MVYIIIILIYLKKRYFYKFVEDSHDMIQQESLTFKKILYFLMTRVDFYTFLILNVVYSDKESNFVFFFQHQNVLSFIIMPLVYIFLGEGQKTNDYLNLMLTMLQILFFAIMNLYEAFFSEQQVIGMVVYLILFFVFVVVGVKKNVFYKIYYNYFCEKIDSLLFQFPSKQPKLKYFSTYQDVFLNKLKETKEQLI